MQLQLDIGIQKKQKNGEYFQLPPTNGYKEKHPTLSRREGELKKDKKFTQMSVNHQGRISTLMALESDNMTIKPRYKSKLEDGYKSYSKQKLQTYHVCCSSHNSL